MAIDEKDERTVEEEDFGTAFDESTTGDETHPDPKKGEAGDEAGAEDGGKAKDTDDEEKPPESGDEETNGEEEGKDKETKPDESDEEKDYKALYESSQTELEAEQQKSRSAAGRLKAEAQARREAETRAAELEEDATARSTDGGDTEEDGETETARKPKPKAKQTQPVELTEEEKSAIAELEEDHPSVHKAVSALLKKNRAPAQVVDTSGLEKRIGNVEESMDAQAKADLEVHLETVGNVHPDFKELAEGGDLDAWIEEHSYKEAMSFKKVRDTGTAEQCIGLLDQYKEARGLKKPESEEAGGEDPPESGSEETPESKVKKAKKAASSEAVPHKGGAAPKAKKKAEPDKDDFDGGWEDAVADEEKGK